jgi:hypothetical protein
VRGFGLKDAEPRCRAKDRFRKLDDGIIRALNEDRIVRQRNSWSMVPSERRLLARFTIAAS